jgi:F-type H+-transporting ATPase subunit b
MIIDWFTVGAQGLNFILLVWLLKHFLFRPLLNAVDQREARIGKELAEAAAKASDAEKQRNDLKAKNEEFDRQRAALLAQATTTANEERQRLISEAKKSATDFVASQKETLQKSEDSLIHSIASRAEKQVFDIARKALKDLSGVDLQERIIEIFIGRFHNLTAQEKQKLFAAVEKTQTTVTIRTTFPLAEALRLKVEAEIRVALVREVKVDFQTDPEFIGGIELISGGQKLAWTLSNYLQTMQIALEKMFDKNENGTFEKSVAVGPPAPAATAPAAAVASH